MKVEPNYRNSSERMIGAQLEEAGISFTYEGLRLPVEVPARTAHCVPDFPIDGNRLIIEYKGAFGGPGPNHNTNSAAARQKFLLMKEQYPQYEFRIVFANPKTKIYKGSPTSYAKWADDNGIKWAAKKIPQEWLQEIKDKLNVRTSKPSQPSAPHKARVLRSAGGGHRRRSVGS